MLTTGGHLTCRWEKASAGAQPQEAVLNPIVSNAWPRRELVWSNRHQLNVTNPGSSTTWLLTCTSYPDTKCTKSLTSLDLNPLSPVSPVQSWQRWLPKAVYKHHKTAILSPAMPSAGTLWARGRVFELKCHLQVEVMHYVYLNAN